MRDSLSVSVITVYMQKLTVYIECKLAAILSNMNARVFDR